MAVEYRLHVKSAAGVLQHIVTDFNQISYSKVVNAPGLLTFDVATDHNLVDDLTLDSQLEVWRADSANSIAWYCDFYALFRAERRAANSDGSSTFTAYCPGQMSLLDRAIIAYPAGTANRTVFTSAKAETVANTLVKYNATSSGTTGDGRIRDVAIAGVGVEADGAAGNTIDFNCSWRYLLNSLQDVARIGGGDYDLIKTAAATWEWRWYVGQLGTDRSATVTFSLAHGNMANPILTRYDLAERTVAIVAGQGEGSDRLTAAREGGNYDADDNYAEVFVDARNYTTAAGLQGAGDNRLAELEAGDNLVFDVLQVPSTLYGSHYFLGDLVTGYYEGFTATKKIDAVTVGFSQDGREQIGVQLSNA